ncbi:MAG: ETC complex I subunit [Methylocystis sp.]|nr:ETC complex I subunit [Methylocystis sp.]
MTARIYRSSTSATQSGPGPAKCWLLVFEPEAARGIEPLMGWTSSSDMKAQIRLRFPTKEAAVCYARRNEIPFEVEAPQPRAATRRIVSYADNFKTTRIGQWTH